MGRAAGGNGRADQRIVGMLQVLLKALDPSEVRLAGPDGGAIPIAAVITNVQTGLGMLPADVPAADTELASEAESAQPGLLSSP